MFIKINKAATQQAWNKNREKQQHKFKSPCALSMPKFFLVYFSSYLQRREESARQDADWKKIRKIPTHRHHLQLRARHCVLRLSQQVHHINTGARLIRLPWVGSFVRPFVISIKRLQWQCELFSSKKQARIHSHVRLKNTLHRHLCNQHMDLLVAPPQSHQLPFQQDSPQRPLLQLLLQHLYLRH